MAAEVGEPIIPAAPTVQSYVCTLPTVALHVAWAAASSEGGPVTAYELQYREDTSSLWHTSSNTITGDVSANPAFQIQTIVTTCTSPSAAITAGYFRLSSAYDSVIDIDVETGLATTPLISYQATADEMQHALLAIQGLPDARVTRDGPDANGGYQWHVTFHEHHPRPLLSVLTSSLDHGTVTVLLNRPEGLMCDGTCGYIVSPVTNATSYVTRVRASNALYGWGPWSAISDPFTTCALSIPRAVEQLRLVHAGADRVTLAWDSLEAPPWLPVRSYRVGTKCASRPVWSTATVAVTSTTTVVTNLPPHTACVFRMQAVNAIGAGPFGPALSATTLAVRPSPPLAVELQVNADEPDVLRLSFAAPADDGGDSILGYVVAYKPIDSGSWTTLAATTATTAALSGILPYTRYLAQVTAVNAVGSSEPALSRIVRSTKRREAPLAPPPSRGKANSHCVLLGASAAVVANANDVAYMGGVGNGGTNGGDGQPGLVLFHLYTGAGERLQELVFDFVAGSSHTYRVPPSGVAYIDIYAWGGGGGSGKTLNCPSCTTGGGGGFARAPFQVVVGDILSIQLGGGGKGYVNQGAGGASGGGVGGRGAFAGGGGGGASLVRLSRDNVLLLVAAGGGGGASSDYCCANGGAAGGTVGAPGLAATAATLQLPMATCARDEFHSRFVFGDTRDFTGRPAHDQNINFGTSPHADYSELALGGSGGSHSAGGLPGQQSSYAFVPSSAASNGYLLHGGQGGDGMNGGGGGGAGFFGGGGGGGGLAGAGGGGGASMVNCAAAYEFPYLARLETLLSPQDLTVTPSPMSLLLRWQPPLPSTVDTVMGYVVEMAPGIFNTDFNEVGRTTSLYFTIDALSPATDYVVRVKALTPHNHGSYVGPVPATTAAAPENLWRMVPPQQLLQGNVGGGVRRVDAPTAGSQSSPSARRGHSLAAIDDYVYLFGGFGPGYACQRGNTGICATVLQENNELWRYHARTQTWLQLLVPYGPSPREKHSAVVLDGAMVVFGGRQLQPDGSATIFNDLWQLTGASVQSIITSNVSTGQNLPIADGMDLWTTAIAGADNTASCLAAMAVTLVLQHACPSTLEIGLYGPGPDTFSPLQQDTVTGVAVTAEATWSTDTYEQATVGNARVTPPDPKTRGHRIELFAVANATVCTPGTTTLVFNSATPPLQSFSKFLHLPAGGVWTLQIHDRVRDGQAGVLLSWNMSWTLTPCVPSYQWLNVSSGIRGTPPPARYQHSAVVAGQSMFVFGGKAALDLSDLYRLDYVPGSASNAWVPLTPVGLQRYYQLAGGLLYLSPYQALVFSAGVAAETFNESASLSVRQLRVSEPKEPLAPVTVLGPAPSHRYFTAAAGLAPGATDFSLVLFGGQDHTGFLGDTWQLELPAPPSLAFSQSATCDWQPTNAQVQAEWAASCGATTGASQPCSVSAILLRAWCDRSYQTITNFF
ncbi:fibronectin type III domain-containing protein [Achlya hypogyna]|uniref:Fibronectin type III domain-containing protein n=1 Tax=Achlya hypogyna TaxID=1202772 RepID=A0A1V9Z4D9_ACHHY|nr:fibronectin type III domain-containing protein [Achlya hypogyna]